MTERRTVALFVAVFALLIVLARLHTVDEPLEHDITIYSVIAHEMTAGRRLYSDLWDHKPPAVFVTYALAQSIVGYGPWAVFLIGTFAALAGMLGAFFAGKELGGHFRAGLWAACFWTLVSSDPWLQANQPNTEVFVNACRLWAFFFLLRARAEKSRSGIVVAGALFALASLYKQTAAVSAIALMSLHLLLSEDRRSAFVDFMTVAALGFFSWFFVGLYFFLYSAFGAFWKTVVLYNLAYAGSDGGGLLSRLVALCSPSASAVLYVCLPLLLMLPFSLAGGFARALDKWRFLLVFFLASIVEAALPGRCYPHYYQLLLPPLVIACGAFAGASLTPYSLRPGLRGARGFNFWAACLSACFMLWVEFPMYFKSADEWSNVKYGNRFIEERDAGLSLGRIIDAKQSFYCWGEESGLYFYSRHSPPSGLVFTFHCLYGPFCEERSLRLLNDLKNKTPDFVVINRRREFFGPVARWIEEHYEGSRLDIGSSFVVLKRGGGLKVAPARALFLSDSSVSFDTEGLDAIALRLDYRVNTDAARAVRLTYSWSRSSVSLFVEGGSEFRSSTFWLGTGATRVHLLAEGGKFRIDVGKSELLLNTP